MDIVSGAGALLVLCLAVALGFEFVNGFHDTANAVATVIYTRSLKPGVAVLWSGLVNFLGVLLSGGAVAFGIIYLLPADLLASVQGTAGVAMILSILITAVLWNLGTWYIGLPASSSHTLIGSILGVGVAYGMLTGKGFLGGLNVDKATETLRFLLISPLIGFTIAALLMLLFKALIRYPKIFQEPVGDTPPPWPIRLLLIGTCTGVSFFHGSNDGQKGIGLIMLTLIALLPTQFTVNPTWSAEEIGKAQSQIALVQPIVRKLESDSDPDVAKKAASVEKALAGIEGRLDGKSDLHSLALADQAALRADALTVNSGLKKLVKATDGDDAKTMDKARKAIAGSVEYIAPWVIGAVAIALGLGTMVGWKRIVVTVGEKIGKSHLTYAQGACAELTAMMTIFAADKSGLPISTTHVLSSGIAGTMTANGSGLQLRTIRNIAIAWCLTLPVTMLVSGLLFALTTWGALGGR